MLRRYRHIIWDWNGTLLDDLDLTLEVVNGALQARGLPPMERARYHDIFDFPIRDYYRRLGLDTSEESFHALCVEFTQGYNAKRFETALHRHAEPLLVAINAQGITQSILSAYPHPTLCEIIAHFGLTSHFVRLNGLSDIYGGSKVALGRAALAELHVPPEQVLLIGDTLHDFEVATELGVDCALMSHGHHPAIRLRARCPHVYEDFAELSAALGVTLLPDPKWPAETAGRGSPGE